MGQVLQFLRSERAFDSETTAVLVAAYEKAIAEIENKHQPAIMREVAARRIIALALKGERDPDRLYAAALAPIVRAGGHSGAGAAESHPALPAKGLRL
jgi:hypothetical protein